jgi:hypothetical protein
MVNHAEEWYPGMLVLFESQDFIVTMEEGLEQCHTRFIKI